MLTAIWATIRRTAPHRTTLAPPNTLDVPLVAEAEAEPEQKITPIKAHKTFSTQ